MIDLVHPNKSRCKLKHVVPQGDDNELSVLQAPLHALDEAAKHNDTMLVYLIKEVISHLEHAGAVQDPTSLQERGLKAL